MLVVETIAKIRRAYFQERKKIKQICRDLRVSRNTVPVNGSSFRTDCTRAASPSWPLLKSTGCVATRMRTLWDGIITMTPERMDDLGNPHRRDTGGELDRNVTEYEAQAVVRLPRELRRPRRFRVAPHERREGC